MSGSEPVAPAWVYAPPAVAWPLPELRGRIGRSQAPQLPIATGITGDARVPLRLATPWTVPGDGASRAVVQGLEGVRTAIELIDVDRGVVVWRVVEQCTGPVVGVTESAIVCADASGVRAFGLDGKSVWEAEAPFLAFTSERVVTAGPGEAIILDAADGNELARIKLPAQVTVDSIIASCGDAGRELFAAGQDGKLARIADVRIPPPARPPRRGTTAPAPQGMRPGVTWAIPIGHIDEIDACTGTTILVREAGVDGGALVAIERGTGKITGRIDRVHGYWRARDGSDRIEIATAAGIASWPRDLTGVPAPLLALPLGELLAERGDARLVRASRTTAVILDRAGVRAYLPFAAMGAVLGDRAILGASWTGALGSTLWRSELPARYRRTLRVPARRDGVALPAELRDLPAVTPLDLEAALAKPDTGKHAVLDVAIDSVESAVVYTLQHEAAGDSVPAGLASVDLAKRAWRWQRADGCAPGETIGFAVAREVVVCASRMRNPTTATVRATSRDGVARWEWEGDSIEAIAAAGDAVVVFDADRAIVLEAVTGHVLGHLASDDADRMRAALVVVDGITFLVAYERGRVVAHLPAAGMLPVWSLGVDGVVANVAASSKGVMVALEDGDAYLVDAMTATVSMPAGLNLAWRAQGDVITGETVGGPIPGTPVAPPAVRVARPRAPPPRRPRSRQYVAPDLETPPQLWTPIPPPPPIGDSWQYTLYDLDGTFKARNDYALTAPIQVAGARGPAGSPLVIASGAGMRDVLVLDPRNGDPVRRVQLPEQAAEGLIFGTVVDGTPVAGAILTAPLRVIVF